MGKVNCTYCGFFCWDVSDLTDPMVNTIRDDELLEVWRNKESLKKINGSIEDIPEHNTISCLRNQWVFSNVISDTNIEGRKIRWENIDSITTPRRRIYYFKYRPGSTPAEHKELEKEAENRKTTYRSAIMAAAIGAAAAILAQILYAIVTHNK